MMLGTSESQGHDRVHAKVSSLDALIRLQLLLPPAHVACQQDCLGEL